MRTLALLVLLAAPVAAQSPAPKPVAPTAAEKPFMGTWEGPYTSEQTAPGELRLVISKDTTLKASLTVMSDQPIEAGETREPLQFGAANHIGYPGRGRGSRHVDRSNPGVGNLASHKNGMQSIGKLQVRHELTLACQKPSILLAQQRSSDKTIRMRLGHYLYSGADRILAAASMTAATMFW